MKIIVLRKQSKKERFAGSTMGVLHRTSIGFGNRSGFIQDEPAPPGYVIVIPGTLPVYDHEDYVKKAFHHDLE